MNRFQILKGEKPSQEELLSLEVLDYSEVLEGPITEVHVFVGTYWVWGHLSKIITRSGLHAVEKIATLTINASNFRPTTESAVADSVGKEFSFTGSGKMTLRATKILVKQCISQHKNGEAYFCLTGIITGIIE